MCSQPRSRYSPPQPPRGSSRPFPGRRSSRPPLGPAGEIPPEPPPPAALPGPIRVPPTSWRATRLEWGIRAHETKANLVCRLLLEKKNNMVSTIQLLLFATLGFYLLLGLLKSQATISMDTDWFYRRLRMAAFLVGVSVPSHLFGAVEKLSLQGARALISFGANPVRFLRTLPPWSGVHGPVEKDTSEYDPDSYRLPVGVAATALLLFFSALFLWSLG